MIRASTLAAALALAGCATPAGYSKARTATERIDAAYQLARGPAVRLAARLPEPAAGRAIAIIAAADAALAIVNSDAPMIDRVRAADDLMRAVRDLRAIGL